MIKRKRELLFIMNGSFKPYNSTPGTNGDESNLTEISRICQQQLVAILIVAH